MIVSHAPNWSATYNHKLRSQNIYSSGHWYYKQASLLLHQGILKGNHCTTDLLFDWFGLVCFANKNKKCQLSYSWFQTSQTGGQWYGPTTLSITTFSLTTLCITTLSTKNLLVTLSITTLSIMKLCRYVECHCSECLNLFIGMVNVIVLSAVMLSDVMPSVVAPMVQWYSPL
jgi:hypothetical protein